MTGGAARGLIRTAVRRCPVTCALLTECVLLKGRGSGIR